MTCACEGIHARGHVCEGVGGAVMPMVQKRGSKSSTAKHRPRGTAHHPSSDPHCRLPCTRSAQRPSRTTTTTHAHAHTHCKAPPPPTTPPHAHSVQPDLADECLGDYDGLSMEDLGKVPPQGPHRLRSMAQRAQHDTRPGLRRAWLKQGMPAACRAPPVRQGGDAQQPAGGQAATQRDSSGYLLHTCAMRARTHTH